MGLFNLALVCSFEGR